MLKFDRKIPTIPAIMIIFILVGITAGMALFCWETVFSDSARELKKSIETGISSDFETEEFNKMAGDCLCRDLADGESLLGAEYEIRKSDLNNDGKEEIIVLGGVCEYDSGVRFAGGATGNEMHCIFQQKENIWVEIGNFIGNGPEIKETRTNGYSDFENIMNMGFGGCLVGVEEYQWDGVYYKTSGFKEINLCEEDFPPVSNFKECAEAGYPILESYPRQCRTPEGKIFVEF